MGIGIIVMEDRIASSNLSLSGVPDPYPFSVIEPFHLAVPFSGAKASFLETSVGSATLILLKELLSEADLPSKVLKGAVEVIAGALEKATKEPLDADGCEVLYGRAGLLYALLLLRKAVGRNGQTRERGVDPDRLASKSEKTVQWVKDICSDEMVRNLVNDIVRRGKIGAEQYARELGAEKARHAPPLMWQWHGKRYLGACHGVGKYFFVKVPDLLTGVARSRNTAYADLLSERAHPSALVIDREDCRMAASNTRFYRKLAKQSRETYPVCRRRQRVHEPPHRTERRYPARSRRRRAGTVSHSIVDVSDRGRRQV